MNLTKQTNRFALFFFVFFIVSSQLPYFIPGFRDLPYSIFSMAVQLIYFFVPIVLYFLYTKKDPKDVLKLRPLGWKNALLVICLAFAIMPLMSFFSFLTSLFFTNVAEESFQLIKQDGFLLTMISMAVFPALLEEFALRGVFLSGYRRLGNWKAVFCTALLFALLHMNPQQAPYAFFAGMIFCFLVQRTGSIWSSIIPHFIVNGTNTLLVFLSADTSSQATDIVVSNTSILLTSGFMAFGSLPILALLIFLILKVNPVPTAPAQSELQKERFFTLPIFFILLIFFFLGILPYVFL